MRCKTCDYPLWNLPTRICPECGAGFSVRDFEFLPANVEFHCPSCDQVYYGTGAKGHLVPEQFNCVTCARPLDMDDMVVRPWGALREAETAPGVVPWLDRERHWFVRWINTVGMGYVMPADLARSIPEKSKIRDAMYFGVATLTASWGLAVGFVVLYVIAMGAMFGGIGLTGIAGTLLGLIAGFIATVVWACVVIVVTAAAAHTVLWATGSTAGGFGRTAETIAYTTGPNTLLAVPCCGFYIGLISCVWWGVSAAIALQIRQGVEGWRAALTAVVTGIMPIVMFVAFMVLLIGGMVAMPMAMGGGGGFGMGPIFPVQDFTTILTAPGAAPPRHAAELIVTHAKSPDEFILPRSNTTVSRIPLGSATLSEFWNARDDGEKMNEMLEEAIAALPENVIAHRLGDFVFTYHGIDPGTADGSLWVVVGSPAPEFGNTRRPDEFMMVGQADGTVNWIDRSNLARMLQAQNILRERAGLAPLPDPDTITHGAPAVAP